MNKRFFLSPFFLAAIFTMISCAEEKIETTQVQNVQVVKSFKLDLPLYKEFVGSIYGYKDIPIRARVEGFLESINFEEGEEVKQGQLLYTIDSQPFQQDVARAQSKVAEAQTVLVNAESELARYKPLEKSKAVSQSDVDAAQAARDAAVASLNASKANLRMAEINLSYASMKSPLDGIIGKTSARVGEYVGKDPNPVILNTVSRLDTVRVQFFLSESQYLGAVKGYVERQKHDPSRKLRNSEQTKIELFLSDGSMYQFPGYLDFIDRNIEASTGAILVQASFPNPDRILRPGLYAKVKLMFTYDKNSIVIPQRCVIETQGQYSVMVLTDSNTIEVRQIQVGETIKDVWQVKEGLSEGDQVVFEGLQKVRGGSKVNPEIVPFKFEVK